MDFASPTASSLESPNASSNPAPQAQSQIHRRRLNREERKDILVMRRLGYTYRAIAEYLHVSHRAVQYTCESNTCDPKKRPGRNSKLSTKQVDDIENFLTASKENQSLSYKKIIEALDLDVKQDCLRRALQKRGYVRQVTSVPNCQSNKRSQLIWEIYKGPNSRPKEPSTSASAAQLSMMEQSSLAELETQVTHHHHRQSVVDQSETSMANHHSPINRYTPATVQYQSYQPIGPELNTVPPQLHPNPYQQPIPPQLRHISYIHISSPHLHHSRQPVSLDWRSTPPQYDSGPFPHHHSLSTGSPQLHSHNEYHSIFSNKLQSPLPEYRQALSEYCPSLIDRRPVPLQTPPPLPSPHFESILMELQHRNLSRSVSPGLCQTTGSHNQMASSILEVSSLAGTSRKSSGYSTPLTIPDDRSDYYRFAASVPPDTAGIEHESRIR
ncbi:hypothetical protein PABG_04248 [Paracoccidioides brasiliensis Pb03]|nr:hypothetical protein PABG_04248 [Paracoccidioides brasiliensis Pb03]